MLGGQVVARSERGMRVLETSHPPTYYLPLDDVHPGALRPAAGRSYCEWKGIATFYDVQGGSKVSRRGAWTYLRPTDEYRSLAEMVAFFPENMDWCSVDGEHVVPQPGGFYGGWITSELEGPFKGEPGSEDW